jgi:hypothetical protein
MWPCCSACGVRSLSTLGGLEVCFWTPCDWHQLCATLSPQQLLCQGSGNLEPWVWTTQHKAMAHDGPPQSPGTLHNTPSPVFYLVLFGSTFLCHVKKLPSSGKMCQSFIFPFGRTAVHHLHGWQLPGGALRQWQWEDRKTHWRWRPSCRLDSVLERQGR